VELWRGGPDLECKHEARIFSPPLRQACFATDLLRIEVDGQFILFLFFYFYLFLILSFVLLVLAWALAPAVGAIHLRRTHPVTIIHILGQHVVWLLLLLLLLFCCCSVEVSDICSFVVNDSVLVVLANVDVVLVAVVAVVAVTVVVVTRLKIISGLCPVIFHAL
jgi:hypothetical protein